MGDWQHFTPRAGPDDTELRVSALLLLPRELQSMSTSGIPWLLMTKMWASRASSPGTPCESMGLFPVLQHRSKLCTGITKWLGTTKVLLASNLVRWDKEEGDRGISSVRGLAPALDGHRAFFLLRKVT